MARGMLQPGAVGRRLFLVLLCAAVLWTGTARAATGILAVGDFGVGGPTERELGAAMERFAANHPAAALLVTLGDNDYTESPSAFHRNWTASFGWLGSGGLRVAGTSRQPRRPGRRRPLRVRRARHAAGRTTGGPSGT